MSAARVLLALGGCAITGALLVGCGPTFEQRIELREQCEANGGTYHEWRDGLGTGYLTSCDLERDES